MGVGTGVFVRLPDRIREHDADREWPDQRYVIAAVYGKALPLDARLQRTVDRLEEIVAMGLDVEAEQVVAEQSVQQLLAPGEDPEGLAIGPRDVPELGASAPGGPA